MDKSSIFLYYDKPCKFKLRGGKEVYGVIWKDQTSVDDKHLFASSEEYFAIQQRRTLTVDPDTVVAINIDDVVAAEAIQGIIPGKDMFK